MKVSTNTKGDVIVDVVKEHLSAAQARALAAELKHHADIADMENNNSYAGTAMTNREIASLIREDFHLLMDTGYLGKDRTLDAVTDAIDNHSVEKIRQENIDNMRSALRKYEQSGATVEAIIQAVLHEPYLCAIAGLRAQLALARASK